MQSMVSKFAPPGRTSARRTISRQVTTGAPSRSVRATATEDTSPVIRTLLR